MASKTEKEMLFTCCSSDCASPILSCWQEHSKALRGILSTPDLNMPRGKDSGVCYLQKKKMGLISTCHPQANDPPQAQTHTHMCVCAHLGYLCYPGFLRLQRSDTHLVTSGDEDCVKVTSLKKNKISTIKFN